MNRPTPLNDNATQAEINAYCAWRDASPMAWEIPTGIELIPVADRGNIPDWAITGYDNDGIAVLHEDFDVEAFMKGETNED